MNLWKILPAAIAVVLSSNLNATTVFNVQDIQSLEWLELTATANQTRNQVESELGSGGMFDGWRYASRTEVETLYDSLWGGTTETWSVDNYSGARMFFDAFGVSELYSSQNNSGYRNDGYTTWNTYFGVQGDACVTLLNSCIGSVSIFDTTYGSTSGNKGWFEDMNGLSTGIDETNYQLSSSHDNNQVYIASHLVRATVVPVPVPAWLFGSGIIGLIGLARRKANV